MRPTAPMIPAPMAPVGRAAIPELLEPATEAVGVLMEPVDEVRAVVELAVAVAPPAGKKDFESAKQFQAG
jgi:hypothetical protein